MPVLHCTEVVLLTPASGQIRYAAGASASSPLVRSTRNSGGDHGSVRSGALGQQATFAELRKNPELNYSITSSAASSSPSGTSMPSALADWAEENGYRTNVIQMVLAHRKKSDDGRALGSQDLAYMRTTLFDERRKLPEAWATFVTNNRD